MDLDVPEGVDAAMLDALVARWGQGVRFAFTDVPDVVVGMAHGHALAVSADDVIAAMMLTADTIKDAP